MTACRWASVPGFEGLYEVSDQGTVRNARTMKVLKPRFDKDGYSILTLWKGSPTKKTDVRLHRIVLISFSHDSDLKVDHINRKRTDNRLENLRWATDTLNSRNRTPGKYDVLSVRFRQEKKNPWQAYCYVNKKFKSLGHFPTYSDAANARIQFERTYGYGNFT